MKPGRGRIDKVLVLTVFILATISLFLLYSATNVKGAVSMGFSPVFVKQCVWVGSGLVLMFLIANTDYMRILVFSYFAYILFLGMLVFLLIFGGERYGAKRWIDLGFFSLQPSEFVKIVIIFVLASFLGDRKERAGSLENFLLACSLVAPAFVLIMLQPDLGTALVLVPILFSILYVTGESKKYLITSIIIGVLSCPILWNLLKDYQKSRLLVFLNPNLDPLGAGYTIIQSKIAIGSGGLLGKGWLNGTQSQLKFLPERHTDFIFSVVGEEWGFVGAVIIIAVFAVIIARGIRIITGLDDLYGRAIATGIITLIAFQVFVNISMTIGMMPVVGLPLPLISYGGSNAMVFFAAIGFLLSISRERKR